MSVVPPSMVHRSGDSLIVRSVVSGDAIFGSVAAAADAVQDYTDDGNDDDDAELTSTPTAAAAPAGAVPEDVAVAAAAATTTTTSTDLPECKVKRNYSCSSCDFYTQNPRHYLYHLRDVHEEKVRIYECPHCLYASKHFQKLLRHTKMVHNNSLVGEDQQQQPARIRTRKRSSAIKTEPQSQQQPSPQPQQPQQPPLQQQPQQQPQSAPEDDTADEVDDSSAELEDEFGDELLATTAAAASGVFKCSMCQFTARTSALLTRHEREDHIKTKFFKCNKCAYATHMKARFTKHVKYHSMPMIKCEQCDFRTPYKWNLDRHSKNHNGRGAFRCSACNFTADIKQSLTVHEMNHHVPPVGQAAGVGVGRRRNKVGASDATAAEEAAVTLQHQQQQEQQEPQTTKSADQEVSTPAPSEDQKKVLVKLETTITTNTTIQPTHPPASKKLKLCLHAPEQSSFGSDFIHPDDVIHHANGNVYIKSKCKLCNFKSAWATEMTKHEKKVHNIVRETSPKPAAPTKKSTRPIPNLIPLPLPAQNKLQKPKVEPSVMEEPVMSQQDIKDICAKSKNSSLKDFASLFGSEDVFKDVTENNNNICKVPDLLPASFATSTPNSIDNNIINNKLNNNNNDEYFKQKNASFFDKLKERLMTGAGGSCSMTCKNCGHESKCLTEQAKHQKICGKEISQAPIIPPLTFSSSRCQYCRQRCKSSADLYNHLQTCSEALKTVKPTENNNVISINEESEGELRIDESQSEDGDNQNRPHPMENRVFVWNNIEVPMDIEVDDTSPYEFTETESKVDDNVSLDLSIRTQSPVGSENSYPEYNTTSITTTPQIHHQVPAAPTTEKIPTHGNDISVAQHKRVFRCPHCTFWASTASRFHVHIVGHLNKKPFECSLCNYRSNWRWDITKHIKLKSVRDPAHESAKVLMTDETGRRNYTKYNKYLTEIHVSGDQTLETSGGSGTRPKHHDRNQSPSQIPIHKTAESSMPKLTRAPNNNSEYGPMIRTSPLRPPPPLKAADGSFFVKVAESKKQKSSSNAENKRTLFKCKKCNFRDASREILLAHVKGHYPQNGIGGATVGLTSNNNQTTMNNNNVSDTALLLDHQQDQHEQHENDSVNNLSPRSSSPELKDEASVSTTTAKGTQAPFRCGHCNQVSNWKHVIQRHCRLKHSGDIRVVSNKNGQERLEIEEQTDEPDHVDVIQTGTFKCNSCPYSSDVHGDFKTHLSGHSSNPTSIMKCHYCNFFVDKKEDILDHLKLHGVLDPDDFLSKMLERNALVDAGGDLLGKRFKCLICPYVTNSKSQYTYHKQFHKPRGGQYTCTQCSYNVSKRHLLHQHLKVHGISVAPQKQNGDVIDLDDMSDEIEEVVPCSSNSNGGAEFEAQHFLDIPLVWVSKNGKFSKMFKCRYCPHVNLRKVNIQEHEKMHSIREKNPNTSRPNDVEHRCSECNYVCNNAGVLSSHSKVHQGLYGTVHCLVDQVKSDEEQIRELTKIISPHLTQIAEPISLDEYENAESSGILDSMAEDSTDENASLYFCRECPARFMKEAEYSIHLRLHGVRLFYKCTYCSYSARQKPHLLAHKKVHTSEYQDRTRVLQTMYNPINTPPQSYSITDSNGDLVWLVYENIKLNDVDMEDLSAMISKPTKSTVNVPLSGTELFQQKNEAEQKQQAQMLLKESSPPSPKVSDTQFGALMHGNPEFIYPTYVKNGRMKEKRYKCHKCPSAFEKREQYKVHLNLHGSKQRYRCEHCDYSVKYYANFVQHLKKHKMNSDAQAARRPSDPSDDNELLEANEEIDEDAEENADPMPNGFGKLSVSDQQAYKILQQRLTESSVSRDDAVEDKDNNKKQFHCPNCPYVSHRKDAVDNHQKRHTSVSGIKNNFTCEHCDYSVPQEHFLREHVRLHFIPNKRNSRVDGYMLCDNFKLVSSKIAENNDGDECKSSVIFEEKGLKQEDKEFLPPLSDEVTERFNNNDGERRLVSVSNAGELTTSTVVMDKTPNDKNSSATVVDESHGNNSSIGVVNGEIEDS